MGLAAPVGRDDEQPRPTSVLVLVELVGDERGALAVRRHRNLAYLGVLVDVLGDQVGVGVGDIPLVT